jgi:hypothetical protein
MFYRQIIKGSIKFVIISMLEKQQMYGYEKIKGVRLHPQVELFSFRQCRKPSHTGETDFEHLESSIEHPASSIAFRSDYFSAISAVNSFWVTGQLWVD